jgi:transposase
MTMSDHKPMSEPSARRVEVFTGAGRRRDWSEQEKAAVVAESYATDTSVSQVARRFGLTPSQLFTWRRLARLQTGKPEDERLSFVPAVVEAITPGCERMIADWPRSSAIEVDIEGVTIHINRGADEATIASVISALRAKH